MGDFNATNYVGWEEVFVSSEKGKREVRYLLKRADGKVDLAIVGKEKSSRHMSYRFVLKELSNCDAKLSCRRDVFDWIHSIVSGNQPSGSLGQFVGDVGGMFDLYGSKNPGQSKNDFRWLGSAWTCPKKRRHYKSFCRNGIVISSQDFVYVLAEEGKRLVAYLEDLYQDCRGNKMVVVRWFHKIDEVGFTLPRNYSDREIFFSLCLQDLSIECIDGLATILSPDHYEKYIGEATGKGLIPFVCFRMFDNDDVNPFDITTVKGYWKQEILRKDFSLLSESDDDNLVVKRPVSDAVGHRPTKRIRCESYLKPLDRSVTPGNTKEGVRVLSNYDKKCPTVLSSLPECASSSPSMQCLTIGSQVEVLSQDSGIRGCWFRGLIVKRIKNKVKISYQDLRDPIDDTKSPEEWLSAFRVASPDGLGIRIPGRTMVRPCPSLNKVNASFEINVGSIVDAWWCDGWWEGIVVKKESKDRLTVHFPGERQEKIFASDDLRHSAEWVNNSWQMLKERSELVPRLSGLEKEIKANKISDSTHTPCNSNPEKVQVALKPTRNVIKIRLSKDAESKIPPRVSPDRDLREDNVLAHWKWRYSRRKRSNRGPIGKVLCQANCPSPCNEAAACLKFYINSSVKFDTENCKYSTDVHLRSSDVRPLTNLVMSQ